MRKLQRLALNLGWKTMSSSPPELKYPETTENEAYRVEVIMWIETHQKELKTQ
jgi:hypothetical protein